MLDPTNVHARDMIQAIEEFLLQSMPARQVGKACFDSVHPTC